MGKVYLVWSGEYSATDVNEVFSTREMAEEYARLRNEREYGEDYRVEERDVVEDMEHASYPNYTCIRHVVYDCLNKRILKVKIDSVYPINLNTLDRYSDGKFYFCISQPYKNDVLDPISNDRLLKIAQDRWAQFKARMEGIG